MSECVLALIATYRPTLSRLSFTNIYCSSLRVSRIERIQPSARGRSEATGPRTEGTTFEYLGCGAGPDSCVDQGPFCSHSVCAHCTVESPDTPTLCLLALTGFLPSLPGVREVELCSALLLQPRPCPAHPEGVVLTHAHWARESGPGPPLQRPLSPSVLEPPTHTLGSAAGEASMGHIGPCC